MLSRRLLRIKALKALYAHLKTDADNLIASEKNLFTAIDKAYDLYFMMLALPVELVRYAEQRQEIARQKMIPTYEDLHPNTKFVDNCVIRLLAGSDALNDRLAARRLSWSAYPELVKSLCKQVASRDWFTAYMTNPERSFAEDRQLVERIVVEEFQQSEALDTVLEEMSIYWVDDLAHVLVMVVRTLQNLKPSHTEIKVLPEFKSEDDREFVQRLFEKSLVCYDERLRYIEKFTENWDVERIAFMDNLLMVVALTEMIEFPSIPVKVTLDEFIEISKYYSTPSSRFFINGILDKMSAALIEEGTICKSGRGLIDTAL